MKKKVVPPILPGLTDTKRKEETALPKTLLVAVAINLLIPASVFLLKKQLPPEVPLYYGLAEGEAQLTQTYGLIIPSLVSLSITIVNLLLTLIIKNEFLKQILIFSVMATTLLSAITTIRIMILVGSF